MEIEALHISGIIYSEPTTSITDIILAVISFTLVERMKNFFNESFFNNAWRLFFFFMGVSTGIGAICHGFELMLPPNVYSFLWGCMNISSSIAVFFALKATIRFSRFGDRFERIFQVSNYLLLFGFICFTVVSNNFEIFKIHAGIALSIIFLTHLVAYFHSHVGSGSIVIGMLLSFLTVYIHSEQISVNSWFDYKDISHVIMMFSLIMIYNGIYLMKENLKLSVQRLKTA